jgi:hypothetical protein
MAPPRTNRTCDIPGCGRKHCANGLCRMHNLRRYRSGDEKLLLSVGYKSAPRQGKTVVVEGVECWAIPTTKGREFIVDVCDKPIVEGYRWHDSHGYAVRMEGGKTIWVQNEIMPPSPGMEIDHKNRNRLDNRRCNLREATHQDNTFNNSIRQNKTSKYRGVCWNKRKQRWMATIRDERKNFCIGYFKDEQVAALNWNVYAAITRGEFAVLNPV